MTRSPLTNKSSDAFAIHVVAVMGCFLGTAVIGTFMGGGLGWPLPFARLSIMPFLGRSSFQLWALVADLFAVGAIYAGGVWAGTRGEREGHGVWAGVVAVAIAFGLLLPFTVGLRG